METKDLGIVERIVEGSSASTVFTRYGPEGAARVEERIIRETALTLFVNGQDLVTLMFTPTKETYLVAGFLYLEGIINSLDDIEYMRVCAEEEVAEVRLTKPFVVEKTRRTLTSGCGGGSIFAKDLELAPVESHMRVSPEQVSWLINALLQRAGVYRQTGGVHTSALCDADRLLVVAEDVGRHNTIDKIAGECFLTEIPTSGRILLTSGRVSSEMLIKAVKMGVPIVISRSSPTDMAAKLAQDLNVTLIGYARGRSFNVYAHDWRVS